MKKLLILSGKGGTGKTTVASSFIDFSNAKAFADCDVDAPNLHIVAGLSGDFEKKDYLGSPKAHIDPQKCIGCAKCFDSCRFGAIKSEDDGKFAINEYACEGCSVCEFVCPVGAVNMIDDIAGELKLLKNDKIFSTAKLKMGRGNSGKLVTEVKYALFREAKDAELVVIDGSPGIGCPVIASISGADIILVVAEPSVSGINDMKRILSTAEIFRAKTAVCINKFDINEDKTNEIIKFCEENGISFVGKIPYDKNVPEAINSGISVASIDCPAKFAIKDVFDKTLELL